LAQRRDGGEEVVIKVKGKKGKKYVLDEYLEVGGKGKGVEEELWEEWPVDLTGEEQGGSGQKRMGGKEELWEEWPRDLIEK